MSQTQKNHIKIDCVEENKQHIEDYNIIMN